MAKALITATEVEKARFDGRLVVPHGAIITPLAKDKARDLGVEIITGDAPVAPPVNQTVSTERCGEGGDELADVVRAIVTKLLGSAGGDGESVSTTGKKFPVVLAKKDDFVGEKFDQPVIPSGMDVTTVDAISADNGSPMAAGYMTITKGEFPWTLDYDEVQIVLEGELHLGGDGGGKVGRPGDILYVPKGSSITFGTPTWAKFIYVTFPANWEG